MENIAKLKDWDSRERNLNIPSAFRFSKFPPASKNNNSSPSKSSYHSKNNNYPPAIKNDDFLSASQSSGLPSAVENTEFLPVIENNNDGLISKNNNPQLKDWDTRERNLNIPSAFRFSKFPPASKNNNSSPSKSSYHSKNNNHPPAIKNDDFLSASQSSGLPSAVENTDFLPVIENDNDGLISKNNDPQCASKMHNISLVSKRKNCRKLKKEVPDKKPKFSKSKRLITPHMKKFISSTSDRNIFKSHRTYAKKKESISPAAKDTLNCNGVTSTPNSSSEMANGNIIQIVKRNESSPLKSTNGLVDSEDTIKSVASELSADVKHCLFSDEIFSEYSTNVFECSNKFESTDSVIQEQLTSECNNGYLRTRKNLKSHLGGKRKSYCNTGSAPTVKKLKAAETLSTQKILDTYPLLKNTSSQMSNKGNTEAPTVCNKSSPPNVLQENGILQTVGEQNYKAIACVSPTVRKPKTSKSSLNDTSSTNMRTYSKEQGRRKITLSNVGSSCTQSCSNEHTRGKLEFSTLRKRVSILDIAKELSFDQSNQLKDEPHFQSKDITPKLATNSFEINGLNYSAPEINPSKEGNLMSNKVNKLENISCLQDSLPNKTSPLLPNNLSPTSTVSEFKSKTAQHPAPKPVSPKKGNLESEKINEFDNISPCLQNNHPFNESTSSDLLLSKEDFSSCSIEEEKCSQIFTALSVEDLDLHKSISITGENIDKHFCKSTKATKFTKKIGKRKRLSSLVGHLSTVEHPQLPNSVFSESDSCAVDIETTKRPKKLSSSHVCSKIKLLHVPLLVCDCNNPNSCHINTDLLSLSTQINKFTSTVVSLAKKNPQKLHTLITDSTLSTFCKRVEKLFLQNGTENNSVSPDSDLRKTTSPTSKTELSNSSLSASCSIELESDLQMQSMALNSNLEVKIDTQNRSEALDFNVEVNHCTQNQSGTLDCNLDVKNDIQNSGGALDFNFKDLESKTEQTGTSHFSCDLNSETGFQNQRKSFIENAFDQINFIHNCCITQLMFDYIGNCDAYELQASVQLFCDDPQTVEVLSKFLSEIEEFGVLPFTVKLQYKFPVNFQDLPLFTVIKDYIKYFIFKIYPLNCESITSQSVLNFANENMSASEISAVSCFFNKVELLKPTDFLSRFTCVAIVAIYNEYQRRKESIS